MSDAPSLNSSVMQEGEKAIAFPNGIFMARWRKAVTHRITPCCFQWQIVKASFRQHVCHAGGERGRCRSTVGCSWAGGFALTPLNFYWAPNPQNGAGETVATSQQARGCGIWPVSCLVPSRGWDGPWWGPCHRFLAPGMVGMGTRNLHGGRFYKIFDLPEISGFRQLTWKPQQDAGGGRPVHSRAFKGLRLNGAWKAFLGQNIFQAKRMDSEKVKFGEFISIPQIVERGKREKKGKHFA